MLYKKVSRSAMLPPVWTTFSDLIWEAVRNSDDGSAVLLRRTFLPIKWPIKLQRLFQLLHYTYLTPNLQSLRNYMSV